MQDYKKCYFMLFSAICDEIEYLEKLLQYPDFSEDVKQTLQIRRDKLKLTQQNTEELLIN